MLYSTVDRAAPAIADVLRDKRHALLITHVNPDGDAVGSVAGLGLALEARGLRVTLFTPTPQPAFVANVPTASRIRSFTDDPSLPPDCDVVILVDTGDARRIGRIWEEARDYLLARPMMVIDHHVTNTGEGIVNYVDPSRSSTCELIFELLRAWEAPISPEIATCLLFGIITDTQSFRTSNTTPSALRAAADLLERGGDQARVVTDVYASGSVASARLLGQALEVMEHDEEIVWTFVSQAMYQATGADDDASADVTEYLAALGGFRASVLFKERRDGAVKVSLRAAPPVDVAIVAQQFGGGGHRQAAGCTIKAPLAEARERMLAALRASLAAMPRPETGDGR